LDEAGEREAVDAFEHARRHPGPTFDTKADEIVRRLDEEEGNPGEYDCAICLGALVEPKVLGCGHSYCKQCLQLLRNKGVQQSCPLCRVPLPPGPEQLFDIASRFVPPPHSPTAHRRTTAPPYRRYAVGERRERHRRHT